MQIKVVIASSCSSYSGEEVRYSHGSGGLVAPLDAAVLAECDVGASVDQGLVGVVVVGQQALLELALVVEDCLEGTKRGDNAGFNRRSPGLFHWSLGKDSQQSTGIKELNLECTLQRNNEIIKVQWSRLLTGQNS